MAPDHVVWAYDNRAAMVRVIGADGDPGDALRKPRWANPRQSISYMASQIAAGLDGIAAGLDPGPPADAPYASGPLDFASHISGGARRVARQRLLPQAFGDPFVDYFIA